MCWRGGTQCWSNDAGEIERCESAERDEFGLRTTTASTSTLQPVDRLAETIGGLGLKAALDGTAQQRLLPLCELSDDKQRDCPGLPG